MFTKYSLFTILLLISTAVSNDCPDVINLAFGLGMPSAQPLTWAALQSNCCSASGITCIGQVVTEVTWVGLGLNVFINETAIPSSMTSGTPSIITRVTRNFLKLQNNIFLNV